MAIKFEDTRPERPALPKAASERAAAVHPRPEVPDEGAPEPPRPAKTGRKGGPQVPKR